MSYTPAKTYYITRVIKLVVSVEGQTNRAMEQSTEIDPHKSDQLTLTGAKAF